MKKILALAILVSMLVIASIAMVSAKPPVNVTTNNNGNPGSIWTTRENCEVPQNENHYDIGDEVWIRGEGFDSQEYDWEIKGLGGSENSGASCDPATIVASGSYTVDESGDFCFNAYTVENDNCGEYKAIFNNKHDNYNVIPEFGLFVGGLTILAAVGIFFFVRRK